MTWPIVNPADVAADRKSPGSVGISASPVPLLRRELTIRHGASARPRAASYQSGTREHAGSVLRIMVAGAGLVTRPQSPSDIGVGLVRRSPIALWSCRPERNVAGRMKAMAAVTRTTGASSSMVIRRRISPLVPGERRTDALSRDALASSTPASGACSITRHGVRMAIP